jgi:hypothetical protein
MHDASPTALAEPRGVKNDSVYHPATYGPGSPLSSMHAPGPILPKEGW